MKRTTRSVSHTIRMNFIRERRGRSTKLRYFPVTFGTAALAVALAVCALAVCALGANTAHAQQWRTTTPRDTTFISARSMNGNTGFAYTAGCISTKFYFSGTFGVFPWQVSTGFDARYLFSDPVSPPPHPLANPPTWNGTNYQVYLQINNHNNAFATSDSLHVDENSYQPNHEYSVVYPGDGSLFYFRVYNQLNTYPDGSQYKNATGGITIRSARFTAGISIQHDTLSFLKTNVGQVRHLLDSIASYGLDPLLIDSVWIDGPQASNFSLISQRGYPFALDSVSTNEFEVSYAPPIPNVTSSATLHIHCTNTGCQHIFPIVLSGLSAAPNGSIGPDTIDFGTVRVGSSSLQSASAWNSGSAAYLIDSISIVPMPGTGSNIFATNFHTPGSDPPFENMLIPFQFTPAAAQFYEAKAIITDGEGKVDTVVLIGNGAMPHVIASDSALVFGSLFTNDDTVLFDTISNIGNWTAHVVRAGLGCADTSDFSFDPSDTSFYLDAGASRIYGITFRPVTTIDASLDACLKFYSDDGSQPVIVQLSGVEKQRQVKYDTNIINFGRVKVGDSLELSVGVDNASPSNVSFNYQFVQAVPRPGPLEFQLIGTDSTTFNLGTNSLHFVFQPTVHSPAGAWIHMQCYNGQVDSIYMYGFGAVAQPVFTPPIVGYGICKDSEKYYGSTVLTDTGDYPLDICSMDVVGPYSSEFTLLSPKYFPDTVADSGAGSLAIGFTFMTNAHTGGVHWATLEIHYCDGSMDTVLLEATEATESIQFCSHIPIDFGKVRVGSSRNTGVCFGNNEGIDQTIGRVWITLNGEPFYPRDKTASVPANGTYYDTVVFTPPFRSHFSGWLHGGGGAMIEDSVPISGIGAQSVPVLSADTMNFGKVTLLNTSNPMTLTLRDTGDWPLAVELQKIGDSDSEFTVVVVRTGDTVDPIAEDSVAIGDSSTYSVTFTPRLPKLPDHEAKLIFHYDDGTVDTVILIGKDRAGFLAFDRDTINFGVVRVGTPPPDSTLLLINTSDTVLTATQINEPQSPFSAIPAAPPIRVGSDSSQPVQISFAPKVIGPVQSVITGKGYPFSDSIRNSVVLVGIGAAPVPKLSVDTLNFDTVALGRSITRSFSLSNLGNWPLTVSYVGVTGPNKNDFTPTPIIPANTTIDTNGMATYSVTFTASQPLQLQSTPRIGYIVWTLDDGSTDTLVLIANDVPPLHVQIGFPHAYWGRPGDKIAAELDLQSVIPDTLGINHFSGTITFDPTMVDFKEVGPGNLDQKDSATFTVRPGAIHYDIYSDSSEFTTPGSLINLMFQLHTNLQEGASSPLLGFDTIPGNQEVIASDASTTIFLDSICGTIHLLDGGEPIANFIEQNVPNPFGIGSSSTTLPFSVDADNTIVTIRLLDPTGREVLRPIDHQAFAQGRYETTIDATSLTPGIYFYEFQANGEPPQMLKMAKE